jgi:hypothetical protein
VFLRPALTALACVMVVGCSGGHGDDGDGGPDARRDGPPPEVDAPIACPSGDRTMPIELAALWADGAAQIHELADGAEVDLLPPFQGGYVIYVGVKAKNVDGCNVQLTAALRDTGNNQVIALEQRPVHLDAQADGWATPTSAYNDLANVPACPNAGAISDVDESTWQLELRLDEVGGRTATAILAVAPVCRPGGPGELEGCQCQCDADFVVGSGCPLGADGGV